ncbi:MAG: hypothetical protein EBU46_15590 [Nitrosomonadaceae bacterium]|nr:hypothetical protein [Nitrosomonadaceae bacterium]
MSLSFKELIQFPSSSLYSGNWNGIEIVFHYLYLLSFLVLTKTAHEVVASCAEFYVVNRDLILSGRRNTMLCFVMMNAKHLNMIRELHPRQRINYMMHVEP